MPAALPPPVSPAMAEGRKLRTLCLHGYLQNAEVFRTRIGSLRKALKSRLHFEFVEAPHVVEGAGEEAARAAGGRDGGRSWWQWQDADTLVRPSRAAQYSGWEASLEALTAALEKHAPVHLLLGFSQGSTAAALLLAELQRQQHPALAVLRGVVLVGGFVPRDAGYAARLAASPIALPSLHVYGASDALVPPQRSQQLRDCFGGGAVVRTFEHGGAHMVPTCSGSFKAELLAFIDEARGGEGGAERAETGGGAARRSGAGG